MTEPTPDDRQDPGTQTPDGTATTQPNRHEGEMIGATGEAQGDPALEKDPEEWVSGDDPMTASQRSYLDTLAKRAGETLPADLTKAEASEHIDRLQGRDGG